MRSSSGPERPARREKNNLDELFRLFLQQYGDLVNRKERLENKALGHLVPLSIILAASLAVVILIGLRDGQKGAAFLLFLGLFFLQLHFSVCTFCFALKAYSVKTYYFPKTREYARYWNIKKRYFLGGINKSFSKTIGRLEKRLKGLSKSIEYCRVFLGISLFFGLLNITFFIAYLFYHYAVQIIAR